MANDSIAGLGLKNPEPIDWNNFNPGTKYVAPPPVVGPDGKNIVYTGVFTNITPGDDGEGLLEVTIDPITIIAPPQYKGYELRFTRAGVRKFPSKNPNKPSNGNKLGTLIKSAGSPAKPQTNEEYVAAVKSIQGRPIHFTLDWQGYNKDTQEKINGYASFPLDPERPGSRKSILRAGDTFNVTDKKGNIVGNETVKSEVIFANARVRYFVDPSEKK